VREQRQPEQGFNTLFGEQEGQFQPLIWHRKAELIPGFPGIYCTGQPTPGNLGYWKCSASLVVRGIFL
jgi:hypothetical protein